MNRIRALIALSFGSLVFAAPSLYGQAGIVSRPLPRELSTTAGTLTLGSLLRSTAFTAASSERMRAPNGEAEFVRVPGDRTVGERDIRVALLPSGVIQSVSVQYDSLADIDAMVAQYRVIFGSPADSLGEREVFGVRAMTWVWRDARTQFALTRYRPALRNGPAGIAKLQDVQR